MTHSFYYLSILRKRAFVIIIGIVILYISLAIYSDSNQFIRHFQKIEIELVVPILVSVTLAIFIKGIRQLFFLRQIGIKINLQQSTLIYFAGLSMLFTPGSVGQMIKSRFLLKNYSQPISKTIQVVIVERYHDALDLFSFMLFFSLFENITILRIPIFVLGAVLLIGVLIVKNRVLLQFFEKKSSKIKFLNSLPKSSSEFNSTLFSLSTKQGIFYGWLLSIIASSFDAIGIFLCFEAFRLNFNFGLTTALGFSSIFFGAISLVPGGTGVTEVSFVQLLSYYGLELSSATALVLFFRLSSIWYSSCIGLVAMKFASKSTRSNSK